MKNVKFLEEKILIDTYPEAASEQLPMFAENRVHQRTSGNPYPNKVVLEAQRSVREKREYTLLKLENEYLEIGILPALGGKIWYAKDKKSGYDFFYKNNVVKPALIGVLGSWTSGGLEFNWPFHHRASTFMPVDYAVEEKDGEITVWLSEHDPIDRMKGMVGVSLKEGECIFHTKVKVDNTTSVRRSFLWWENTAVPVDENYSIFFPEDVNYVRFHYKRSVTTYPIANNDRFGAYNGIRYHGDTDISQHKNTQDATSYFSAESEFDFFGGYDHKKEAGVVHVANHHISPGKKLFTWAYSQLSKTWENALTDTDGQYAELMAGCYSDNQPDFAWLAPFECKTFTQSWFPIHSLGTPTVATTNGALYVREDGLYMQSTRAEKGVKVTVNVDGKETYAVVDLPAYEAVKLPVAFVRAEGNRVTVSKDFEKLVEYTVKDYSKREIPSPRKEYPEYKKVETAEELYLLGVHMEQYRSPEYSARSCYEEALVRQADYVPALTALAETLLKEYKFEQALDYINRAEKSATRFNTRLESGKIYYIKGLVLLGLKKKDAAYDYFYKAAWCADSISAAMLHIALIDISRGDYSLAEDHLSRSLAANANGVVANAFYGLLPLLKKDAKAAVSALDKALEKDKLNLYAHAFKALASGDFAAFNALVDTDKTQVLLDVCEYMLEAGLYELAANLIDGVEKAGAKLSAMADYVKNALQGEYKAVNAGEGIAFPSRAYEKVILEKTLENCPNDYKGAYLLGCLLYGKGHYEAGAKLFEKVAVDTQDYRAYRNLSVAYYSHLGDVEKAKAYMKKAVENAPKSEKQITFEWVYLLAKTGANPEEIIQVLFERGYDRDELTVELARAYNHCGKYEEALEVLLNRNFVACEGGEHYIADQYTYARYLKGADLYKQGKYALAREEFEKACHLPQSLGSGFWNETKKVPFEYFIAACLEKEGKVEEAKEIYKSFGGFFFDFFSNMYLITLCYYVARGYERIGEREKGEKLIKEKIEAFEYSRTVEDTGHFSTTPFFISFIDDPKKARFESVDYPLYLCYTFLNEKEKAQACKERLDKDGYGMYLYDFTL